MQVLRKNYNCQSNKDEISSFQRLKKSISTWFGGGFFYIFATAKSPDGGPVGYWGVNALATYIFLAQMVELVDTLVSGTSERKLVQVRVLFWAHILGAAHFY